MTKTDKVFFCNVDLALDVIGGKWKPLIIYHLANVDAIRFGEFKRLIPNVNERVLARQLKELEENHIIHREDFHENPPRVEYSLADSGQPLPALIVELSDWAKQYNADYNYGKIRFEDKYEDYC